MNPPLCATKLLLSDHVCFTEGKMGCVPTKSSLALWWAPFLRGRGLWGASNLTVDLVCESQAFCGESAGHVQAPLWYQRGGACFPLRVATLFPFSIYDLLFIGQWSFILAPQSSPSFPGSTIQLFLYRTPPPVAHSPRCILGLPMNLKIQGLRTHSRRF